MDRSGGSGARPRPGHRRAGDGAAAPARAAGAVGAGCGHAAAPSAASPSTTVVRRRRRAARLARRGRTAVSGPMSSATLSIVGLRCPLRSGSASSTGATALTVSPSSSRATRTPVASRPCAEISLAPMRMILPPDENTRISSSGATVNAATTAPRDAVIFMPRTPWPPRPWRLNVLELGALAVAARAHEQHHRVVAGRRRSSRRRPRRS